MYRILPSPFLHLPSRSIYSIKFINIPASRMNDLIPRLLHLHPKLSKFHRFVTELATVHAIVREQLFSTHASPPWPVAGCRLPVQSKPSSPFPRKDLRQKIQIFISN